MKVFPDNFMKREVLALKIHCPQKNEGCNWKGEVRELEVNMMTFQSFKVGNLVLI